MSDRQNVTCCVTVAQLLGLSAFNPQGLLYMILKV